MTGVMDETSALLQNDQTAATDQSQDDISKDVAIIDFETNGDSENPMDWPKAYKWSIVALLAFMSFTVTFTCISVVPVANRIVAELNHGSSDKSAAVLLVTIWELGEAVGPLFIAPFSELFGRWPLMNIASLGFIAATVLGALSQSTGLFIATRMLTGLAVASNVLNPAIIGDIFITEQRGTAMSVVMIAPLLGGAVGPAIAGAIAESLGWRAVLWMSVICAGSCEIIFLCCFRETYKVTILRRRAARLRNETGNPHIKTEFDLTDSGEGTNRFWSSISRPFTVFFGSGVLQAISLFGSMTFAYFYIMSTTLPDILEQIYHLSPALTGFSFICFSIGSVVSVTLCNLFLDRIYIRLRESKTHAGVGQPEFRLPLPSTARTSPPVTPRSGSATHEPS